MTVAGRSSHALAAGGTPAFAAVAALVGADAGAVAMMAHGREDRACTCGCKRSRWRRRPRRGLPRCRHRSGREAASQHGRIEGQDASGGAVVAAVVAVAGAVLL